MGAGLAALQHLNENKNDIYPYLKRQGDRLSQEVNQFCKSENIPAKLMNAASMFVLGFSSNEINSSRDIDSSLRILEREFYIH